MSIFKNFKIESVVLGILFLNIFLSYNVDIGFFSFFKNYDKSLQDIFLKDFFKNITVLGDSKWYFVVSVFFIIVGYSVKRISVTKKLKKIFQQAYYFNIFLFFSVFITGVLTQLLKHLVGRPRPNHTDLENSIGFNFFTLNSDYHSFPSGHASTIFVVALVASFFVPKLRYVFVSFALLVAFSRVVVGAHFFTDIIGGLAISFIGFKITKIFLFKFYKEELVHLRNILTLNKVFLAIVVFTLILVLLSVGPSIDIYVSGLFYFGNNQFLLQSYYDLTILFRKIFIPIILIYLLIIPMLSMILPLQQLYFNYKFTFKDVVYLWGITFFNLVVVVNLFLKNGWGRARPGDILELGGKKFFTPWYEISNNCNTNCSFVSGDAAVGFSLIVFLFLIKNNFFYWFALIMGISLGLIRIMEGGHFLSDVVMSGSIIFILSYIVSNYYLVKKNAL